MAVLQPTHIVILGGGGDLAQRKLLPALFDLYTQKLLPTTFRITGFARSARSDAEYQSLVKEAILRQAKKNDRLLLDAFCEHIEYVAGSFDDSASYSHLELAIKRYEHSAGSHTNKLFYLAVPPAHYGDIFKYFSSGTFSQNNTDPAYWTRLLIEKPFGHDHESASTLDQELLSIFDETQIFRIDHYLAKEAVQNILSFRFANVLLRSAWNKEHIEAVHITMHESINAESRGTFYDGVGALRDVGQNHLLQILALIAMEEPKEFTAKNIRENRAAILERLIPISSDAIQQSVVRGQYEGFTETKGVRADSNTETYFAFRALLDDPAWTGVPFYISAGKAIKNDEAVIEIRFKEVSSGPFKTSGNAVILTISPVQSMNITLNVKKPGHGYAIEPNTLSFAWDEENRGIVNAYEKVLLDCIEGDRTLFTTAREVLASWKFINSITDIWEVVPLQKYEQGSAGPAQKLIHS